MACSLILDSLGFICYHIMPWLVPLPKMPVTRTIISLVGDPYKPSFATVTGRGDSPNYTLTVPKADRTSNWSLALQLRNCGCFPVSNVYKNGIAHPCSNSGKMKVNFLWNPHQKKQSPEMVLLVFTKPISWLNGMCTYICHSKNINYSCRSTKKIPWPRILWESEGPFGY